jgi:hypothetical protein
VVLQGPRALRELAQIVVHSTKCMGKGKSLYVPQQLMAKIEQRGGAARLKQCMEGNKAPQSRDFTRFLAKAISERQQTWPSQTAVKDGTAPKQLLDEWEEGKRLAKVNSPPPERSPPTSPRPRKENRSQPKTEVQDQTGRKEGADYKAALEKGQESAQAVDPGQTLMTKYLGPKKKPSAADEKRQREVARVMEPVIDKIKKEMELGAQGYHVEDAGVPERGEETESDEERRQQRLKRKPSGTQGQGQGKESEKVWVPTRPSNGRAGESHKTDGCCRRGPQRLMLMGGCWRRPRRWHSDAWRRLNAFWTTFANSAITPQWKGTRTGARCHWTRTTHMRRV